jgi:formiminotetrahydrofolate cyclodeaminase
MWSDLAVASSLAQTGVDGGLANVQINLQEIKDPTFKAEMLQAVSRISSGN